MDRITIKSHEQVDLEFILAGIGRRGLAGLIDVLIQLVLIIIVTFLFVLFFPLTGGLIKILGLFIFMWGYRFFFELYSHGQTPGKKKIGIAVVGEDGRPPNWRQCLLRSLFNLIDVTGFFALAGISIFCTSKSQRIGDLVAGTYVVVWDSPSLPTTGVLWLRNLETKGAGQNLRLSKGGITPETLLLIEKFLERRSGLSEVRRKQIASALCGRIASATGWNRDMITPETAEELLEGVLNQLTGANSYIEANKSSWKEIENKLKKARKSIKKLSSGVIQEIIREYRYILTAVGHARV